MSPNPKMKLVEKKPNGFGTIGIVAVVAVLVVLAGGGYFAYQYFVNPAGISEEGAQYPSKLCGQDSDCSLFICVGAFNKEWAKTAPPDLPCRRYEGYTARCIEQKCTEIRPTDVSNWKTYRNEKYGFEVRYPEAADIIEGFHPKNTAIYNFIIRVYREPHKAESGVLLDKAEISMSRSPLPLRQDISKSDEKFTTLTRLSKNTVFVNNVPAEKILLLTSIDASKAEEFFGAGTTFDFEVHDWIVSFENDGYFYQISTSDEERDSEQFLDSLLSTFKFIK